jgi:hypothetical protein
MRKMLFILGLFGCLTTTAFVGAAQIRDCRSKQSCQTNQISNGCQIKFYYTTCDYTNGYQETSCRNGQFCQSSCSCTCDPAGYTISYYNTCSGSHEILGYECRGCQEQGGPN